jgi:small subunit ribosomal protein S16
MLMIRLQRVGRKNDPSFRLVVMPKQKDSQSGKTVELLGSYNARGGKTEIKADRVKHWIAQGAQVSPTVHNLLVDKKIITGKKINVLPTPVVAEKAPEAPAPAEVAATEAAPAEKVEEKTEEAPAEVAPTA